MAKTKKVKLVKGRKILKNEVQCKRCGDILVSRDPEKILYCRCLAVHISGGKNKTLRGGELVFIEERSSWGA